MHTFIQPASRNVMPAARARTGATNADEMSITAAKTYNNIPFNLPHNFSRVPSSKQIVQTCGCESCSECDEEEENESFEKESETIQHKLTVSKPGDPFEREADQVAEQVMSMPEPIGLENEISSSAAPSISKWTGSNDVSREEGAEEDEENSESEEEQQEESISESNLLSLKGRSNKVRTPSAKVTKQISSMQGSGKPMDAALRSFFEPRFQRNFSNVRIHTDARAAETTKSLNAKAYTVGEDIAVSPDEYKPETAAGRKLLAHELTHVVQQSGRVQTIMRTCDCAALGASNPSSAVEAVLTRSFPYLRTGEYCVTAPATATYNCFAWSIGDTSSWMDSVIDTAYGNGNGTLEYSDFDRMYDLGGLEPVTDATPSDAEVALYGIGSRPTHAARKTGTGCGAWESKLGRSVRISHEPYQLEGGTVYGDINRYYRPK